MKHYTNEQLDNIQYYITNYSKEIINTRFHDTWKKHILELVEQARVVNGTIEELLGVGT